MSWSICFYTEILGGDVWKGWGGSFLKRKLTKVSWLDLDSQRGIQEVTWLVRHCRSIPIRVYTEWFRVDIEVIHCRHLQSCRLHEFDHILCKRSWISYPAVDLSPHLWQTHYQSFPSDLGQRGRNLILRMVYWKTVLCKSATHMMMETHYWGGRGNRGNRGSLVPLYFGSFE